MFPARGRLSCLLPAVAAADAYLLPDGSPRACSFEQAGCSTLLDQRPSAVEADRWGRDRCSGSGRGNGMREPDLRRWLSDVVDQLFDVILKGIAQLPVHAISIRPSRQRCSVAGPDSHGGFPRGIAVRLGELECGPGMMPGHRTLHRLPCSRTAPYGMLLRTGGCCQRPVSHSRFSPQYLAPRIPSAVGPFRAAAGPLPTRRSDWFDVDLVEGRVRHFLHHVETNP